MPRGKFKFKSAAQRKAVMAQYNKVERALSKVKGVNPYAIAEKIVHKYRFPKK